LDFARNNLVKLRRKRAALRKNSELALSPPWMRLIMLKMGIPITRENYIIQNWQPVPEDWDVELESELPRFLQDWTQFGPEFDRGSLRR
jgi:hypothetical protein